jgi:hypothetical protein
VISSINCPVVISPFAQHSELKTKLLELISTASGNSLVDGEDNITKTDWNVDNTIPREYLKLITRPLLQHLEQSYQSIGMLGFEIHNFWYQQYSKASTHAWHNHQAAQYTNIYYLELPDTGPKTQILNPMNSNEVITLDVKEGDIVSFPSFIFHRSPAVLDDSRKTIISFNVSFLKSVSNPLI